MKKIIFSLSFLMIVGSSFAQLNEVQKIFEKYNEVEGITSIKISKAMFGMLSKINIDDEDVQRIKPLLKNVNSLNILISGGAELLDSLAIIKPGFLKLGKNPKELQGQINDAVKNLKYEELVTVNSSGRKIKLLTVGSTDNVLRNLLLSITGSDQNVLMLLDGEIPMDLLSKFISDAQ